MLDVDGSPIVNLINQEDLYVTSNPDRFWIKVAATANPNLCWLWMGTASSYGGIKYNGSMYKSHRVAYYLHYGKDPIGLEVMHSVCDNPKCCNPNHLSLGTHGDNMADMVAKGRQGTRHKKII